MAVLECGLRHIMRETCKSAVRAGIEYIAFGDLFLSDIRAYREKQLENSGLQPIFPVGGLPTRELALSMIKSGMRAKLTCIDSKVLAPEFVGREFNEQLLSDLPPEIDPCGENGKFHTFVYAGPMLERNRSVEVREIHELSAVQGHAFSSRNPNCNMRLMRSLSESQHSA